MTNERLARLDPVRYGLPAADLARLQTPALRLLQMMQAEARARPWQPGAGALGPLHQDGVAFAQQPLPVEIGGFVGGPQPVAVEMEDRPAPPLIAVHQRVGRAARGAGDTEPPGDRLDEGGLPRPELPLERHHRPGLEAPSQPLTLGLQLGLGQRADHARRRTRGAEPRTTSGAPIARSSVS